MRRLALVLVAFVAGCGSGGSTSVGTSSTPPSGGADGGVGVPSPDGGGTPPGGGGMPGGGGGGSGGTGGTGGTGGAGGAGGGGPSACPTTPTVIGMNFEPRASDGAYIYGFGVQQIARIPVGGGAQATVVGSIDTSVDYALLVAGGYVYWTVSPDAVHPSPRMFRAAKAGGDQPAFLTDSGSIVADDAFVYTIVDWMGNGNGLVSVAQSDGHVSDEQIGGGGNAAGVDDLYVYYEAVGPDWPANVALWRVSKAIGAIPPMPQQVATWPVYDDFRRGPARSVSDGKSAFFWDFGRVVRVEFATGTVTLLYDPQRDVTVPGGDRPGQMAVDDTSVYWTTNSDYVQPRYMLDAVDKDGHGLRTVYSSNDIGGHGVVVVGDSVYFNAGIKLYQQCKR